MAYKGTAGKSATGASMSKYDVEVVARLQALEAAVKELQAHSHDTSDSEGEATDSKLERLVAVLKQTPSLGLDQYDNS